MSIFDKIKVPKPKRSNFDLSHDVKLTTDFGRLTPFLCTEVMPGDSFKCSSQVFARLAPMLAPVMNRMDVYTHFFFVPMRLLWDKWEDFITGGEDGLQMPSKPFITLQELERNRALGVGSLADHLGLPVESLSDDVVRVDELPFRAYSLIWNEWYRDQNLEDPIDIGFNISGEQQVTGDYAKKYFIKNRAWRKDYFTSALPWPQRGQDMRVPMHFDNGFETRPNQSPFKVVGGTDFTPSATMDLQVAKGNSGRGNRILATTGSEQHELKINPDQWMLDGNNLGPTVNELRRSIQIQKWLEANARGGARYIEQILSHFGVVSSDSRLQRPELLGGGKSPVLISEVVNQAGFSLNENSPTGTLGSMAGHGVSAQNSHGFKRYFEEHGYLIGIISFMPKSSYYGGVPRMWSKRDKFDYAWPEFANLGEQEILNKELYLGADQDPEGVFGYAPRYSEYKFIPSQVHGDFRKSMAYWHLGRTFLYPPKLNADFVRCGSDQYSVVNNNGSTSHNQEVLDRIFNFISESSGENYFDHIWVQVSNNIIAKRPLPYYGTPI